MKNLYHDLNFLTQISCIISIYSYGILTYFFKHLEVIEYDGLLNAAFLVSFICVFRLKDKFKIIPIFVFQIIISTIYLANLIPFFWIKVLLNVLIPLLFILNGLILFFFPPYYQLPKLDGQYKFLGTTSITIEDKKRDNKLFGEENEREILLQLWYPIDKEETNNKKPVDCIEDWDIILEAALSRFNLPSIFAKLFSSVNKRSNSYKDARIMKNKKFPLIIFSHGYQGSRFQNVYICEKLASNGYIVASIEHVHDACISILEDKTVVKNKIGRPTAKNNDVDELYEVINKYLNVRVEDLMVSYKSLLSLNGGELVCKHKHKKEALLGTFKNSMDFDKVSLLGHSFGGATVIESAFRYPTLFRSLVSMDTLTFPISKDLYEKGINCPSLLFSADHDIPEKIFEGNRDRISKIHKTNNSLSFNIILNGSHHQNFSDVAIHFPILGQYINIIGYIDGIESMELISQVVTSFYEVNADDNLDKQKEFNSRLSSFPTIRSN